MNEQLSVLIVDDDPEILELYELYLEDSFQVKTALTGQAALQQLGGDIDVVVMDRSLPDGENNDMMDEIRKVGTLSLIIVSGLDPDMEGSTLEYDDYLVKPVSRDELQTAIMANCMNVEDDSVSESIPS